MHARVCAWGRGDRVTGVAVWVGVLCRCGCVGVCVDVCGGVGACMYI